MRSASKGQIRGAMGGMYTGQVYNRRELMSCVF